MGNLIVQELPYMIAAMAAAPIVLVVGALIIGKADRPVRNSLIFVLGAVLLDVVFAGVILWLYRVAGLDETSSDISAWIDVILGLLFLLIGIKAAVSRPTPEETGAQRERMEKIAVAKATSLLLAGVVVQILNADALVVYAAGLKEIATASPFPEVATIVVVVAAFLVVMLIPYWLPTGLYAISHEKAGGWMRTMSGWLLDHAQGLEVGVGLAFGAIFLWKGLAVLV